MGNGEDNPTGQEAAGSETTSGGDAWLERRLRVFERALNALEERQERSERTHANAIGLLDERIKLDEDRLTEVENHFGESHRALQKAIEEATQRLQSPEPESPAEPVEEVTAEPAPPAEEIVYVEVEPIVQPTKRDLEFLALARRAAIEAAVQVDRGKRKARNISKPLLICLLALSLTLAAAAFFLRHAPGSGSVTAAPTAFGMASRREVRDPDHRLEVLADAGNRRAMHVLAMKLADQKDMASAANWFMRAARLGYDDSQFNLAILYERGEGVPQSLVQAYIWYGIAARSDDAEAAERIEALRTQLKPSQRSFADREINAFQPEPFDASAQAAPLHIVNQAG